ncbi:MAG TPA: Nif3-like dinuclear metal center hexameric protein [Clostridiaceae bacterium]|nr:Nif3-like dinuclear metal center hexameric protein [Clostridiaceae bacterium]
MKLENIITYLEDLAPIPIQERYDNSGLILGNKDSDISKVLVCLDADEKALDHAIEQHCQLVLSHHPVIFGGIKSFAGGSPEGDIVIKAIKNDIALYGCHTNFDSASGGLTDLLCDRLGIKNVKILLKAGDGSFGAGRYGDIGPISGEELISTVKSRLSVEMLRVVGDMPETISRMAVYNGSYDSDILEMLVSLKPIALVTGDLKHHAALELKHRGIFTIDAGHYGTEKLFVEEVSGLLEVRFPELSVIRYEGKDVFTYY